MSGPIELDLDERFQRREWTLQRAGWVVLAAAILGGATGLFGNGPLATAERRAPDGTVAVEYERFLRKRAPSTISLSTKRSAAPARVWISRESARVLDLKRVVPEPTRVSGDAERLIFEFADPAPFDSQLIVAFHVEPIESRLLDTQVGILEGATISMRQFIYP